MFNLYGWVEILTSVSGEDERAEVEAAVQAVQQRVADLGLADRAEVVGLGGSYVLRMTLVQNRDRGDLERCMGLLSAVGAFASGSYGVCHVRDDEQAPGLMRRLVLRRGKVELEEDDIFSPLVPTIEDP
jgi:hypothetical protein